MTRLTVEISSQTEARALTLPVDVYSPDGRVLASGIASPTKPAELQLPPVAGLGHVHVLGKLPSGVVLQQMVELDNDEVRARLDVGEHSPHEWLDWVIPFRDLDHFKPDNSANPNEERHIGQVWIKLWRFEQGRWATVPASLAGRMRERGARLVSFDLPKAPHLLQVGGEDVAWRLVSLPPGGPVRVALTRSANDQSDPVEVTVGRACPENELIMSYLSRGAMAEAGRLTDAWQASDLMLQHKKNDPVSAAAGAYILLKNRRLNGRRNWIENLVTWFPHLADGAIVSAALALQEGHASDGEIRRRLRAALQRGLPVFSLGINVLVETMAAIHRGKEELKTFHEAFLAAQTYARASCSTGAYFAFYGKAPTEPSWRPLFGLEGLPQANRRSAAPVGAVFFGRAPEALVSVAYGRTRVKLPRAPVDAGLAMALRERIGEEVIAPAEDASSSHEIVDARASIFFPAKVAGISAEETSFLGEFSSQRQPTDKSSLATRHGQIILDSGPTEERGVAVPTRSKSAHKQVKAEPVNHAITVFDGLE